MKKQVKVGNRYGLLVVTKSSVGRSQSGHKTCQVSCDCGNTKEVRISRLTNREVTSCGCNRSIHRNAHLKVGQKFGKLTISVILPKNQNKNMCIANCECGGSIKTRLSSIKKGYVKSCGCLRGEGHTHGEGSKNTETKEYKTWCSMRERCLNPNNKAWKRYGGRGITVCNRWSKYENFLKDMGRKPVGTSLDRINNNGDYNSSNCRWATKEEQARNTSRNRFIRWRGEKKTVAEWSEIIHIKSSTIRARLSRGWDVERTMTTKV